MNGFVKFLLMALVAVSIAYLRAVADEVGGLNVFTVVTLLVLGVALRRMVSPKQAALDTGAYPRLR